MRWFRRTQVVALPAYADDGTLPVLVRALDPAAADSAVLSAAGLDLSEALLVRHHLVLPTDQAVAEAARLLAQDGYQLTVVDPGPPVQVRAWRAQVLSALSAAQERSRMAGLAQRLGGDTAGWDASGPARTGRS